jgi:hypothetical protein
LLAREVFQNWQAVFLQQRKGMLDDAALQGGIVGSSKRVTETEWHRERARRFHLSGDLLK